VAAYSDIGVSTRSVSRNGRSWFAPNKTEEVLAYTKCRNPVSPTRFLQHYEMAHDVRLYVGVGIHQENGEPRPAPPKWTISEISP